MIQELRNLPYEERLKGLNLHFSIKAKGACVETWPRFINGRRALIRWILMRFCLLVREPDRTRSIGFKLNKFRFSWDLVKNWWNKLSSHVVSPKTVVTLAK